MYEESAAQDLRGRVRDLPVRVLAGMEGLCELAAAEDADTVLNAVVGMVGLRPTLAAIAAGNEVALANKETLVAGGGLVTRRVAEMSGRGVRLLRWIANIRRFFSAFRGLLRGKSLPVDFDSLRRTLLR